MFRHSLKMALRSLRRRPLVSLVNVFGLAIGMACAVLMLVYLRHELSYDRYHAEQNRIYRLVTGVQGAGYEAIAKVPGPWGTAAARELPGVEQVTRFVFVNETLLSRGEKHFYQAGGLYADSTVFEVFSFRLLRGNPQTALSAPRGMVLTESFARKYFGEEDPLGKVLKVDGREDYEITGVMQEVPAASHFTFDFLVSMATFDNPLREDWRWTQFYTYVLLRPGTSPGEVEAKLAALLHRHLEETVAGIYTPYLQPLTSIHLHSHLFREMQANSQMSSVYLYAAAAVFILLIACVNFINLATAHAATRAKEVGVRKVTGAGRPQLIKQFLAEAMLTSLVAMGLALVAVELLQPVFDTFTGQRLSIDYFNDPVLGAGIVGIALVVGVLAGSYPAFVLSAFRPAQVLKGKVPRSGGAWLRQGLVVFQFAISILFMIASGVVYLQLEYIRGKSLGFNKDQLVILPIRDEAMRRNGEAFKRELLRDPAIVGVAASGNLPGGGDWGLPYAPEGIERDKIPPMRMLVVDHDFITTYEMELAEGRGFSKDHPSDATGALVINEAAAKQLGWQEPLGKSIALPAIDRPAAPVIGVVRDFHFRSMHEKIGPLMLFIPPPEWFSVLSVRIRAGKIPETLSLLERKWAEFDSGHPFTYTFFDEQFARLHLAEARMGRLLAYVLALTLVIACLGLFALATLTAGQRTKEVGMRKILGASVTSIVLLLSRDIVKLVFLGFVVAAPLAYHAMNRWLDDFAYRIELGSGVFLLSAVLALAIAWLTVSFQSVRVALAKPVDTLRYE